MGNIVAWMESMQDPLADDPNSIQLEQIRPLIIVTSWAILLSVLANFFYSELTCLICPRLQVGKLTLMMVLAVGAALTSWLALNPESTFSVCLSAVLQFVMGYAFLYSCLVLPRHAVSLCYTPEMASRALKKSATRRKIERLGLLGLDEDNSEGRSTPRQFVADSGDESRDDDEEATKAFTNAIANVGGKKSGRTATLIFLVFLPLLRISTLYVYARCMQHSSGLDFEEAHSGIDANGHMFLVANSAAQGIFLLMATYFAVRGGRAAFHILEGTMPQYQETAYLIICLLWVWELHKWLLVAMGYDQKGHILFTSLMSLEITVVVSAIARVLHVDKSPVVQMSLTVMRKTREDHLHHLRFNLLWPVCDHWHTRFSVFCDIINVFRPCREMTGDALPVIDLESDVHFDGTGSTNWRRVLHAATMPEEEDVFLLPEETECILLRLATQTWEASQRVPAAWPGLQEDQDGDQYILGPNQLTASEKELQAEGQLGDRNFWPLVPGDLFTNRVRSKFLAVIVTAYCALRITSGTSQFLERWSGNAFWLLLAQFATYIVTWLIISVMLIGNNTFLCSGLPKTVWSFSLCLFLLSMFVVEILLFLGKYDQMEHIALKGQTNISYVPESIENVFGTMFQLWMYLCTGTMGLVGAVIVFKVGIQHDFSNDFHRSELDALRYTKALLEPHGNVNDLRRNPLEPGEQVNYQHKGMFGGPVPSVCKQQHGDGTVDIVMLDGRQLFGVPLKRLSRPDEKIGKVSEVEYGRFKFVQRLISLIGQHISYPATLYFGATATLPMLMGFCCAILYETRCLLHYLYRLHVWASVTIFLLEAYIVPPGAVNGVHYNVYQAQVNAAESLANYHWVNSHGMPTSRDPGPELMYRWDTGGPNNSWPSQSCRQMPRMKHFIQVMDGDSDKHELTFNVTIYNAITTLRTLGAPLPDVNMTTRAVKTLWHMVSHGDSDFRLDAPTLGFLMCRLKLMLAFPHHFTAGQLSFAVFANASAGAFVAILDQNPNDGRLTKEEAIGELNAAINIVAPPLAPVSSKLLVQVWGEADANKDGVLEVAEVPQFMGNVISLIKELPPVFDMLRNAIAGVPLDPKSLMRALDRDHDGRLRIDTEVNDLIAMLQYVCSYAACGEGLNGKVWALVSMTDQNGDGYLDVEDMQAFCTNLQGFLGQATAAAKALCAKDTAKVLEVLDRKHQGGVDATDVLFAVDVIESLDSRLAEGSLSAKVMRYFSAADKNNDGKLEYYELESSQILSFLGDFCSQATEYAAGKVGAGRVLLQVDGTDLNMTANTTAAEAGAGDLNATIYDNPYVSMLIQILNFFQQGWIPLALVGINIGLYISLTAGNCFVVLMIMLCFWKYAELFIQMQKGDHSYVGHSNDDSLKKAFSETTIFPGALFGTAIIGHVIVTALTFVTIAVVILAVLPMCGPVWIEPYHQVIMWLVLTYLLKKIIQYGFLDGCLVSETGDIMYPVTFSMLWFMSLLLNFVIGIATAFVRMIIVIVSAMFSCCFVHFTVLPEYLSFLDTAYYALLALAYTQHEQKNPIRQAFITALMPSVHRVHWTKKQGDESGDEQSQSESDTNEDKEKRTRKLRARNKMLLALTMFKNPELRKFRRQQGDTKSEDTVQEMLTAIQDDVAGISESIMTRGAMLSDAVVSSGQQLSNGLQSTSGSSSARVLGRGNGAVRTRGLGRFMYQPVHAQI